MVQQFALVSSGRASNLGWHYNRGVHSPTLTLQRGQEEFLLCSSMEDLKAVAGKSAASLLLDPVSAIYFLREVITDSGKRHDLRLWLQSYTWSFEMYAIDDESLLDSIARMLATGQLVIAGAKGSGGGGDQDAEAASGILRPEGGAKSVLVSRVETTALQDETERREEAEQSEESQEEAAAVSEETPATTWIELELMDASGNPVPNESYKITMPDGSIKYGRLDRKGTARIEKLQPGSCQVTFPDRDEEVWEVG
jgi:hypothetical protein